MKLKTAFVIGAFVVAGGLFIAYTLTKTDEKPKASPKVEVVKKVVEPNKEWKDLSGASDGDVADFPTNAKEWIAYNVNKFSEPDPRGANAEFDEGYDYYLKATSVSNAMGRYIRVEGEDLKKDFRNLSVLASLIDHLQFVRTADIDPNGKAKDRTEYVKQWKPVDEDMRRAYEYMTKLLNDIDVAINKDGKGKTFGVSHQLNGEATKEMESFITGR